MLTGSRLMRVVSTYHIQQQSLFHHAITEQCMSLIYDVYVYAYVAIACLSIR